MEISIKYSKLDNIKLHPHFFEFHGTSSQIRSIKIVENYQKIMEEVILNGRTQLKKEINYEARHDVYYSVKL